jgi:hypothetical protein
MTASVAPPGMHLPVLTWNGTPAQRVAFRI